MKLSGLPPSRFIGGDMSWGERSCSQEKAPKNEYGGCAIAAMETCNVNCPYYTWDKKTEPDSIKEEFIQDKIVKPVLNKIHSSGLNRKERRKRGIK